jgi:hypothetical protein
VDTPMARNNLSSDGGDEITAACRDYAPMDSPGLHNLTVMTACAMLNSAP